MVNVRPPFSLRHYLTLLFRTRELVTQDKTTGVDRTVGKRVEDLD